jgi:hypothetical protein
VKAGGLQVLLANFLKHNKEVFKQFKVHLKSKTTKDKKKKKADSDESSSDEEDNKKD